MGAVDNFYREVFLQGQFVVRLGMRLFESMRLLNETVFSVATLSEYYTLRAWSVYLQSLNQYL